MVNLPALLLIISTVKNGTETPDARLEVNGDLKVTASYTGFPRPAYDSGWEWVVAGGTITLTHNLGGDINNYVVDLMNRDTGSSSLTIQSIGGDYGSYGDYGFCWQDLTTTSIKVRTYPDHSYNYYRIRIWVYN